jgi:hypothetical protein
MVMREYLKEDQSYHLSLDESQAVMGYLVDHHGERHESDTITGSVLALRFVHSFDIMSSWLHRISPSLHSGPCWQLIRRSEKRTTGHK